MKKSFILFFCLCTVFTSVAQPWRLAGVVHRAPDFFTTDRLRNLYLSSSDGLFLYDDSCTLRHAFTEKTFGSISSVDATDPLKILVFNAAFRKITLLDSRLIIQSSMSLYDLGIARPDLICTSPNKGYWVFDGRDKKLVKFNDQFKKIMEGDPLTRYAANLNPDYLTETSQWIFLNNPPGDILVLDKYGTYYKTIRSGCSSSIQADGGKIFCMTDDSLKTIDVNTGESTALPLPQTEGVKQCRFESGRLFISFKDSIAVYEF